MGLHKVPLGVDTEHMQREIVAAEAKEQIYDNEWDAVAREV